MSRLYLAAVFLAACGCTSSPGTLQTGTPMPWSLHIIDSTLYGADGVRSADFDGDQLIDLISGGEEYGATRLYLNQGNLHFGILEFPSPDVEDALIADINQDGQTEVLTFSEGTTREIALHYTGENENWISVSIPATKGIQWMYGQTAQIIAGGPQEFIVGSKGENAILGWLGPSNDMTQVEKWTLRPIANVGWVMSIEWLNIDGDGWPDILVSDRKGPAAAIKWYQNPGPDHPDLPWKEHIIGLQNKEPMFLAVADLNADGLEDIIGADITEGIFLFVKENQYGQFRSDSLLFSYPPGVGARGKSVCCLDIDLDGALEIVTSYEEAENACGIIYSKFNPLSKTWEHGKIGDERGIKYDKVLPLDIDGDGDLDLFTTEEREYGKGLGVIWYENPAR